MDKLLYELSRKDINILGVSHLNGETLVLFEYRRRLGGNDRWNKAAAVYSGDIQAVLRQVIADVDATRERILGR